MKSIVKIIKQRRDDQLKRLPQPVEIMDRQNQREMVNIVKGWVAELEQRKRAKRLAF